jgi:hypothetical protein
LPMFHWAGVTRSILLRRRSTQDASLPGRIPDSSPGVAKNVSYSYAAVADSSPRDSGTLAVDSIFRD